MTTEDMRQTTQDMASRPTIFSARDPPKATVAAEPREIQGEIVPPTSVASKSAASEPSAAGLDAMPALAVPQEARSVDHSHSRRDRDREREREPESARRDHEAVRYERVREQDSRARPDPYALDASLHRRMQRENTQEYYYSRDGQAIRGPRDRYNSYDSGQSQSTGFWSFMSSPRDNTIQMEVMQLRKVLAEADTRETELRNRLADAERRLVVVTRDLEESRSFVSKEDADARELLTAFNDLNEGVNDLAYLISESLPESETSQELGSEEWRAAAASHESLKWLLRVIRHNEGVIAETIEPIVCHLLHNLLHRWVFMPWAPGMSEVDSRGLSKMYNHICEKEPQDRAARWRSITYQHCFPERDDNNLAEGLSGAFFKMLASVLDTLLPKEDVLMATEAAKASEPTPAPASAPEAPPKSDEESNPGVPASAEGGSAPDPPPETPPTPPTRREAILANLMAGHSSKVVKLVFEAIRLQDKMRSTYLSFDYVPYLGRVGDRPDRGQVEPSDKITHWQLKQFLSPGQNDFKHGDVVDMLLSPTALGLSAAKGVPRSAQAGIERQFKIVVRAKAIVGRLTFIKAPVSAAPPANQE